MKKPTDAYVLVNLGNRYVVFGPDVRLKAQLPFGPDEHAELLPRVGDESEGAEERIAQTLQVAGATVSRLGDGQVVGDIEVRYEDGWSTLVEIKVREGATKRADWDKAASLIRAAADQKVTLQVWFFNLENLSLDIWFADRGRERHALHTQLVPLNVWEHTEAGIFDRQKVAAEVEEWLNRVASFYKSVEDWLKGVPGLSFTTDRATVMSEELMQKYAVPDREVPILDVENELTSTVVASFVPRGLWLIGAWGRIDLITAEGTRVIIAIKEGDQFKWKLISPESRRYSSDMDQAALLELVRPQ